MNYGIFRSQPIMTINDLAQIGSHNKRDKKAYKSNTNIKLELTKNNMIISQKASRYDTMVLYEELAVCFE